MREIKFRGLCSRRLVWVYGYLSNKDVINTENGRLKVIPESVGQYTGLKDRNGKDIYEGDKTKEGFIIYENGCFMLFLTDKYEPFKDMKQRLYFSHSNQEIIGNIHTQK